MNSKRMILVAAGVVCVAVLGVILLNFSFRASLVSATQGLGSGPTRVPTEVSRNPRGQEIPPTGDPASGGSEAGKSTTAGSDRSTTTSPAPRPGSVIRSNNVVSVTLPLDERISVKLGQILVVTPPLMGTSWNVEFDAAKLELAPGLDVSNPPVTGWMWTARKSGTSEIRFSSKVPPCDNKTQQCPDMPSFQAVLLIEIGP